MNSWIQERRIEPAALVVGRLLLATIFLHEGIAKLSNYAGAVAYAKAFGVPAELLPVAIAAELGCGLLVALGLYARARPRSRSRAGARATAATTKNI